MISIPAMLALTVAFPHPGMTLPPVDRCYVSGAVPRGTKSIEVQGKTVDVYRTGGWVTMVDLVPGENTIEIVSGGVKTNIVLKTEKRRPSVPSAAQDPSSKPAEKIWPKLEYAKDEARVHPSGKKPSETVIWIDPGHGGPVDLGATSPHGFFEKEANLLLSREVVRALTNLGYRVEMTRTNDCALVLGDRPKKACSSEADAFVSIHHNATAYNSDPRKVRYTAVYAWNAIGENLAKPIAARVAAVLDGDIPSNGVIHANFAVTRNPEIPSCLVETDFITSPEGEEAIWDWKRRRRIAEAIAHGIDDWCKAGSGE